MRFPYIFATTMILIYGCFYIVARFLEVGRYSVPSIMAFGIAYYVFWVRLVPKNRFKVPFNEILGK